MAISILIILVGAFLIGFGFIKLSPQFGGNLTKEMKEEYKKSENHDGKVFFNLGHVDMNMSFTQFSKMLRKFLFEKVENGVPDHQLPVQKVDSLELTEDLNKTRLIWFGHSTFLLQMDGKNILIDPMFGQVPSPHPWLGGKRFEKVLPIEIAKLPRIDLVILSHDHYDHLDYESIKLLKDKTDLFLTPLAVGIHLKEWGVDMAKIKEFDWWQESHIRNLKISCTPAQHFSGRGLNDRGQTLWASWVIQGENENLFFSGDSGYGSHFKDIGEKYGPFDLAMIECGQYNKMWHEIHMFPEETAMAGVDLRAKAIIPIHWGAFKLALHSWTDPIERVSKKAKELDIRLLTPKIGEQLYIQDTYADSEKWWLAK